MGEKKETRGTKDPEIPQERIGPGEMKTDRLRPRARTQIWTDRTESDEKEGARRRRRKAGKPGDTSMKNTRAPNEERLQAAEFFGDSSPGSAHKRRRRTSTGSGRH